jgi:hypothetical protein
MAGILDKKTRFIDLVVTQEGKRQIAQGKLRAEFASATDAQADYQKSESYNDAVQKIYFQTMERPENQIVPESDDSGRLLQFDVTSEATIVGDKIFQKGVTGDLQKDVKILKLATGSQFASLFNSLSDRIIDNFKKNYFVSTTDSVNINNEFELSQNQIDFEILDTIPFKNTPFGEIINVNDADPIFLDKKLAHLPNFSFLPPINEDGTPYGSYEDPRSTVNLDWPNIKSELGSRAFEDNTNRLMFAPVSYTAGGFMGGSGGGLTFSRGDYEVQDTSTPIIKPFKIIEFKKTSQTNNLLIQIFESFQDSIKKLDIIDGGVHIDENDPNQNFEKHVFYVGKVYFDDFDTPTFINLFTIVFE